MSDHQPPKDPLRMFTFAGRLLALATLLIVGGIFYWFVMFVNDKVESRIFPSGHYPVAFLLIPGAAMGNCQVSKLFNSFSFLSLKAVFVFFWLRFLFVEQLFLALLQAAIRTRTVSVPGDDSKSVKRNEAHPF